MFCKIDKSYGWQVYMTVASIGIKSSFTNKKQINVDINKSDFKWFSERNWTISGKI